MFAAASLSYNDDVMKYYSSTLHSINGLSQNISSNSFKSSFISLFSNVEANNFENTNESLLDLKFVNDSYTAFAYPGSQDVNVMNLQFKSYDAAMDLESLNLNLIGISSNNIGNVVLKDGDSILAYAKRNEEYFYFSDLNYKIPPNSVSELSLNVDLGAAINIGERLHFDIEKSTDISINVGGTSHTINGFYPKIGKHLSIVKPRPIIEDKK
jgi:hypothetical protein